MDFRCNPNKRKTGGELLWIDVFVQDRVGANFAEHALELLWALPLVGLYHVYKGVPYIVAGDRVLSMLLKNHGSLFAGYKRELWVGDHEPRCIVLHAFYPVLPRAFDGCFL